MSQSIYVPKAWAEHLVSSHHVLASDCVMHLLCLEMLVYIRDEYPELVAEYPGVFEDMPDASEESQ